MDDRTRSRALEKVRKCLALAKSNNHHEAETAMRQARKLMDKFQLEHVDLLISSIEESSMQVSSSRRQPPVWVVLLSQTVADAFGCMAITKANARGRHMNFIGPTGSGEMAIYAFDVLKRQLDRDKKEYQANLPAHYRSRKRRLGARYAEAWIAAVLKKVSAFAGMDDEAAEAVDAYMEKHYPEISESPKRRSPKKTIQEHRAIVTGYQDGGNAALHVPMGADKVTALVGLASEPATTEEPENEH